ncbi:hypothetical protein BVIR_391 [Blastochloris viridis]|uniref:Uncharacterized protein n=1 Tax=Blastochloris viridis TaxID=1079 RepID=A0A0P0JDG3_BLAVI|nr:hypothetical protein BVIR_391 [Blastochloris viridis]CUU44111.1 hypothetical protein BVIRIDIS_31580 [Blastochloris viridis]
MELSALVVRDERAPCATLRGYFAQQITAGKRPSYGYPENHLPKTTADSMDMETGFITAAHKGK